ncbi:hypothetical protein GCM10010524_47900 [Streptomyces mexicanus]
MKPSLYFIPIDQATSSRPATISRTQATTGTSETTGDNDTAVAQQMSDRCVVFAFDPVRRVSSGSFPRLAKERRRGR